MVYREAPPERRPVRITYGPFPIRGWRLLGGLVAFLFGAAAVVAGLVTQTVTCQRTGCELTTASFGWHRTATVGRIADIDVRIGRTSGRNPTDYGVVVISDGRKAISTLHMKPGEAQALAGRLRGLLEPGTADEVTARVPGELGLAWFGLALAAIGCAMVYSSLRGLGRMRLVLAGDGRTLALRYSILGLRVRENRVVVDDVRDVRVRWVTLPRGFFTANGARDEFGGVLVIDTAAGPVELDPRPHRGWNVHRRAAEKLRSAFELPPLDPEQLRVLIASDRVFAPPRPAGSRFVAVWLGVTIGPLLGAAIFGVLGLLFGLIHPRQPVGAWYGISMVVGAAGAIAFGLYLTSSRRPIR
jgi:hypothetical protein